MFKTIISIGIINAPTIRDVPLALASLIVAAAVRGTGSESIAKVSDSQPKRKATAAGTAARLPFPLKFFAYSPTTCYT